MLAPRRANRRFIVWLGLSLALTLGLLSVPLLGVLGFEAAFAVGILVAFGAADLGAARVRYLRAAAPPVAGATDAPGPDEADIRPTAALAHLVLRGCATALVLVLPPLVLLSANALRVPQCDWATGLLCFAALPATAALLGTVTGVVAALASARLPRLGPALPWLFISGSFALALLRVYGAPAIFVYDPFAGYYPGALYDENIRFDAPFLWARAWQIALALCALGFSAALLDPARLTLTTAMLMRRGEGRGAALAVAWVALALAITLGALAGRLGFAVSAADVARVLDGVRETPHFVIRYARGRELEPQMDAIAAEHEFRYAQVTRTLGVGLTGRITSYYFRDAEQKQRWMGAGGTYIAKPWRREIYLQHDDFPHGSLRHEIAHVVAGAFGDSIFGVSLSVIGWPPLQVNAGLIEGIAVAADWPPARGRLSPHESARAMLDLGRLPPLARLLSTGFYGFSAAQSYAAAGSFVRFLLERDGPAKLRALFTSGGRDEDFRAQYGASRVELEAAWHSALAKVPVAADDLGLARERFRRPGIFGRPCPHAVARRLERARDRHEHGDDQGALALVERVCADDPDPAHLLLRAEALESAGRTTLAAAAFEALGHDSASSSVLRARALAKAADLHARTNDRTLALRLIDEALALPAAEESTRRGLLLRRRAFDRDQPGATALATFLLARAADRGDADPAVLVLLAHDVIAALPDEGLGHYLLGRVLAVRDAHAEAAPALALAHTKGLAEPLLARENDRLLVRAAFLAGDLDVAKAAAQRLASDAKTVGLTLEGQDWLERVAHAAPRRLSLTK